MEILVCFIYSLLWWWDYFLKLCRKNQTFFYLIDEDGDQHDLNDLNLAKYKNLLVIYRSKEGIKYRFHTILQFRSASEVVDQFSTFLESNYKLFAASLQIREESYMLDTIDFNIVGNRLFTPIFNLWLCSHFFNIEPCDDIVVNYIDDKSNIQTTKGPLLFESNSLTVGEFPLDVD